MTCYNNTWGWNKRVDSEFMNLSFFFSRATHSLVVAHAHSANVPFCATRILAITIIPIKGVAFWIPFWYSIRFAWFFRPSAFLTGLAHPPLMEFPSQPCRIKRIPYGYRVCHSESFSGFDQKIVNYVLITIRICCISIWIINSVTSKELRVREVPSKSPSSTQSS